MIPDWLRSPAWPTPVIFIIMGIFAAGFAWTSYNLFILAMANIRLLTAFGLVAAREGGLRQLLELVFWGYLSLALYIGFKACEAELANRWRFKDR
jgi:hypothetical protein